jgi:NTP pyrophosphatase (non-canonical NTP hydrolase)
MQSILDEIKEERKSQDAKWGEQNHDPFKWLCILGEEVGEVNAAVCNAFHWQTPERGFGPIELKNYRAELIQVAAVAVSMVECLDRGKW